jgi:hypothetical protein
MWDSLPHNNNKEEEEEEEEMGAPWMLADRIGDNLMHSGADNDNGNGINNYEQYPYL